MSSTGSAVLRPDRFGLITPPHWSRFDLSGEELARARAQALRAVGHPAERAAAEDMFRQARALTRAARRHGALWGSGTATFYDDALFMGFVMVFGVSPDGPDELSLTSVSAQLATAGSPGDPDAVESRTVCSVALPHAGTAVRVQGTEQVSINAATTVRMLTMHTLVKVPGAGNDHFLVTCCSPNLQLADEVYELFDAISSTFYFVGSADRSRSM